MAAASQSSFATSAAVFAGGLAVGIGGAFALSRSVFAPSSRPTRSTQQKAKRQLSLPSQSADRQVVSTIPSTPDVPASKQLDAVDAKGAGPAPPATSSSGVVKPVLSQSARGAQRSVRSITGKDVFPEPSSKNRVTALDTTMDLSRAPQAVHQAAAVVEAPHWLTGAPRSAQLSTSTGQIDKIAYESSSAVFVYESGANAGFGSYAELEASQAESRGVSHPKVVSMQTRAGAGAAIAGYLSENGNGSSVTTSAGIQKVVSALTNADGFLAMAPSLTALSSSERFGRRLVLQVSGASHTAADEQVTNNYASVLTAAATVGDQISVVLSGGRQEAVDIAAAVSAPRLDGHVAHVFDGAYAGAQVAKVLPVSSAVNAKAIGSVTEALNAAGFANFTYEGPSEPRVLLVLPNGSRFEAARAVLASSSEEVKSSLGLIAARIVRPWSDDDFLKLVPSSVETIHVLDEVRVAGMTGVLYEEVQATLMGYVVTKGASPPIAQPVSLHAGEHLSAGHWALLLDAAVTTAHKWQLDLDAIKHVEDSKVPRLLSADDRLITFVDSDASATTWSGALAARLFRDRNSDVKRTTLISRYDNFEAGGLVRHDVLLSSPTASAVVPPLPLVATKSQTDLLVINDLAALKSYDVIQSVRPAGTIIINAPGLNGIELANKLHAEDKRALAEKNVCLYLLDANKVVERIHDATAKARGGKHRMGKEVPKETAAVVVVCAVLDKGLQINSSVAKSLLQKILGAAPLGSEGVAGIVDSVASGLQLVAFSNAQWKDSQPLSEAEANAPQRPSEWRYTGFGPFVEAASVGAEPRATRATWALPAWQSMFAEAYKTDSSSLRPDLPEDNYVLTVTENRRLTPLDYDRNVFHMELSTAGTGLKYEVGEALGIHGCNDVDEVREFIAWSGYDADEIISVASLNDPTRFESRTVFQILHQRLDIFGKPPKRFYEVLSKVATDVDEAKWLRFVGSAEGQSTFRKLSEIETVTYADVLRMFPSARVPLDVLLTEVEAIKPRHYSIASAQSFVGDSVHLLVVTVDWRTPTGSPRFGQCTRYLANLKIGDKVTVSLKPSVMKLPPFTTQPIVMSGLGTGAAPFRAYIQARAVQKRQGKEIGPMIYIFGSRYKHAEYLYGEELEAYEKDGIVKVLTAFSRDQKNKIYIQHRIEQNQKEILDLLLPQEGSGEEVQGMFTLCGPTDPLPDVQEALIKGFMAKTGQTHAQGEAWLETLKDEERAVYEVY